MAERAVSVSAGTLTHRVRLSDDATAHIDEKSFRVARTTSPGELLISDGSRLARVFVASSDDVVWAFYDGDVFELGIEAGDTAGRPSRELRRSAHGGSLTSPMPATVVSVQAKAGDRVERGDILIVLEAMKMELPVRAPAAGVVAAVNCRPGDLVQPSVPLIDLE